MHRHLSSLSWGGLCCRWDQPVALALGFSSHGELKLLCHVFLIICVTQKNWSALPPSSMLLPPPPPRLPGRWKMLWLVHSCMFEMYMMTFPLCRLRWSDFCLVPGMQWVWPEVVWVWREWECSDGPHTVPHSWRNGMLCSTCPHSYDLFVFSGV